MTELIPLNAENEFRKWAESYGWRVTKKGWPDFMCRRGTEIMAVEVKWSDWLSEAQEEMLIDLHNAGIATFVWTMASGGVEAYPSEVTVRPRTLRDEEVLDLRGEVARLRIRCAEAERVAGVARAEASAMLSARLEAQRMAGRAYRALLSDVRYLLRATERRQRSPSARIVAIRERILGTRAVVRAGDDPESMEISVPGA
jgi:hypothetical protein